MLELVSLIFEDDAASPSSEDLAAIAERVSQSVATLAGSGDAASETAAIRLLIKETGCSLREAVRVVESVKQIG